MNACVLQIGSADPEKDSFDFLKAEELVLENGELIPRRRFNGDEIMSLNFPEPSILRFTPFIYH